jgi:hypothetical protein
MIFPAATPILSGSLIRPTATRAAIVARPASVAASRSLALAGPLGGQDRVAAGDQPLAGVVRGADLGEVLLIEQRQLQGAVVCHELADRGAAQAGDSGHAVQLAQLGDPRGGDHAPVPGHDHLLQRELSPTPGGGSRSAAR